MAVRVIAGNLQKEGDPLISALSQKVVTHTILPEHNDPFPVCVLGELGQLINPAYSWKIAKPPGGGVITLSHKFPV